MDWIELPLEPRHQRVPSGVSKIIFEPVVSSTQTMDLYCVKISTFSKRTESSFHLSLVPYANDRMRPNLFLSLWYIWRKPWTYLAPTLTQSPSGPKWDSTLPTSPRCSIKCVQNILLLWYVRRKLCTYLASRLALPPNGQKQASTWASSPRSTIDCAQNDFWANGTFNTNRAPILRRY
jgi:hypothetical protein